MKSFKIPNIFIEAIKNQAIISEIEIYGWLIGYQKNNIPHILAIFECKSFEHQTLISAVPNAQEFQELSSLMPQGIGPIGIYHSHPFSSEIFHSHTDDSTLISLSNQFPNCISVVTNGKEINYYQMGKNFTTRVIKPNFDSPIVLDYFILKFEEEIHVKVEKTILTDIKDISNVKIQIINQLRDYYEVKWEDWQLFLNGKPLDKNEIISKYIELEREKLTLFFSFKTPLLSSNRKKIKQIVLGKDRKNEDILIDYIVLDLKINTQFPIYIKDEDIRFEQLDEVIRTELLSNSILRKIFNSIVDLEKKEVILPHDYFLEYFGFIMRVLTFQDVNQQQKLLSQKNKELLYKLISQLNTFIGIDLLPEYQNYIRKFLNDMKELSSYYNWYDEIYNQIEGLYDHLKLNECKNIRNIKK